MAGLADVMQDCGTTDFAGIVYQQIAKPEYTLRNTGGNSDILNLGERDIPSGSSNQAGINFNLGVGQSITNHVSL